MKLSSNQLEAFVSVAKVLNFSRAAESLHLTQSALSQRIKNLEEVLETTLFIRESNGVRLTEVGERLLRYCQVKDALEEEFVLTLSEKDHSKLAGSLHVAGYSSVLRSVVMPALGNLLRSNPKVQCDFMSREMGELPQLLQRGEADFVVLDHRWERDGISAELLGYEENIVIESATHKTRRDVFLDHDPQDQATSAFFKHHRLAPTYTRSYLDDIYGILDGVALGFGRAVIPKHLLANHHDVKAVSSFKTMKVPVYLHYYTQPFYSKLHQAVIADLVKKGREYL